MDDHKLLADFAARAGNSGSAVLASPVTVQLMHTALVNFENTAGMDFAEYRERAQSVPDSLKRPTKSTPPFSDVRELVGYREIFKSPQDTLGQKVFED